MNKSLSLEKAGFAVSLLVFAFLYGTAVGKWGYFPYSFLDEAYKQAREVKAALSPRPDDLGSRVYRREGIRTPHPKRMQGGLTLITSRWGPSYQWGIRLIDEKGAILHEWLVDGEDFFRTDTAIHGSLLLQNGDVILNREYEETVRLNSCGEVLWKVKEGNHHSIAQAEDGSFWTAGVSKQRSQSKRGYPGLERKNVWSDLAVHISPDGEVIEKFNILDVVYENNLERYIPKYRGGLQKRLNSLTDDILHMNDVEPLPPSIADEYPLFNSGDLLVSLRNIHLVFVFDPKKEL